MTPSVLYIGGYAAVGAPGIQVFTFDDGFTKRGESADIANPSFVALHPTLDVLYAVSETDAASDGVAGSVHALAVESVAQEVRLLPLGHRPTGGDHPCHVAVHPHGHTLVVVNYTGGMVTAYPLASDGAIGEAEPSFQHSGSGPHPHRQQGPHPHSSIFSPDGRFVIVADLGIDRLLVHRVTGPGELVHETGLAMIPGSGPRHMAFHPDGLHLFVVGELDNTLTVHRFDVATGGIQPLASASTLPEAPDATAGGNTAADVHVAPDGHHVYVSNRGHDTIALFAFDPGGGLDRVADWPCGGRRPRAFAVSPNGDTLVVATRDSRRLTALSLPEGRIIAETDVIGLEPSTVAFG